jgi:feruloyl esterase
MNRLRRPAVFLSVLLAAGWGANGARAQDADPCRALAGQSLTLEDDVAVAVGSARSIAASPSLPAHCVVSGYIAPQVGFEVRMPSRDWNGRFLQQGCRGLCGFVPSDTTNDALARGYAVATTDMGHKAANSQSGMWALGNPQAKADFGHRATHVTALAAQELIGRFYGRRPGTRLFRGCGTGGRQGLVAAQRYPADFDGVIANGGIVFDFTRLNYLILWSVRANVDAAGRQILDAADLRALHAGALQQCDAADGAVDGVIANPQHCAFSPSALQCAEGNPAAGCLTAEKVEAARKMYAGPPAANGQSLYPGMAPGSELRWAGAFFGADPRYARFSDEILKYFLSPSALGPTLRARDFDLSTPPSVFAATEALVSADNTDFAAFRARGGKILALHGWNESAMPGLYPTQYYDRLTASAGGLPQARDFFRLYMVPGDMHCTSGIPEGRHFDSLSLMERWVEKGVAMDVVEGTEVQSEPKLPDQIRFPIDAANIRTVRPFAPFPETLVLKPSGDPSKIEDYERRPR